MASTVDFKEYAWRKGLRVFINEVQSYNIFKTGGINEWTFSQSADNYKDDDKIKIEKFGNLEDAVSFAREYIAISFLTGK